MDEHGAGGGKWVIIVLAVMAVSVLHFGSPVGDMGMHAVHRELYFIPILLAAFWFGLRMGLVTAAGISALYLGGLAVVGFRHQTPLSAAVQTIVFMITAGLVGLLADRQRKRHEVKAKAEKLTALTQAATVLGHDLRAFIDGVAGLHGRAGGFKDQELDREFSREMGRARILMSVVDSFVPAHERQPMAVDLNLAVRRAVEERKSGAAARRLKLVTELDAEGCLAFTDEEQVSWVVGKLIDNAFEASPEGGEVRVTSRREAESCVLSVSDQGQGVPPQHSEKLFTPFFTTKPGGEGLSLATSLRTARQLGGDLTLDQGAGKGARFVLTVPRGSRT